MVTYAALRFAEDVNLCDRVYWYASAFALKVGERVLAPVGVHDKLQRAVVEQLSSVPPLPFLKYVAAREGARKLTAGGAVFSELGGVRYDEKHYTRFGRVLVGKACPAAAREPLKSYGVTAFCDMRLGAEQVLSALAKTRGAALVFGADADMVGAYLLLLAGVREEALPADMVRGALSICGHGRALFAEEDAKERLKEILR